MWRAIQMVVLLLLSYPAAPWANTEENAIFELEVLFDNEPTRLRFNYESDFGSLARDFVMLNPLLGRSAGCEPLEPDANHFMHDRFDGRRCIERRIVSMMCDVVAAHDLENNVTWPPPTSCSSPVRLVEPRPVLGSVFAGDWVSVRIECQLKDCPPVCVRFYHRVPLVPHRRQETKEFNAGVFDDGDYGEGNGDWCWDWGSKQPPNGPMPLPSLGHTSIHSNNASFSWSRHGVTDISRVFTSGTGDSLFGLFRLPPPPPTPPPQSAPSAAPLSQASQHLVVVKCGTQIITAPVTLLRADAASEGGHDSSDGTGEIRRGPEAATVDAETTEVAVARSTSGARHGVRLFDTFMFFNEFELLALRLAELNGVVDKFILVEADRTHAGKPKPLHFQEATVAIEELGAHATNAYPGDTIEVQGKTYSKYAWAMIAAHRDKLVHMILTDSDDDTDYSRVNRTHGEIEEQQRDLGVARGLAKAGAGPRDLVLVSDIDELPSARVLRRLLTATEWSRHSKTLEAKPACSEPFALPLYLNLDWYVYSLRWRAKKKFGVLHKAEAPVLLIVAMVSATQLPREDFPFLPTISATMNSVGSDETTKLPLVMSASQWRRLKLQVTWRESMRPLIWHGVEMSPFACNGGGTGISLVENGGWHFQAFGGAERIVSKLAATPPSQALARPFYVGENSGQSGSSDNGDAAIERAWSMANRMIAGGLHFVEMAELRTAADSMLRPSGITFDPTCTAVSAGTASNSRNDSDWLAVRGMAMALPWSIRHPLIGAVDAFPSLLSFLGCTAPAADAGEGAGDRDDSPWGGPKSLKEQLQDDIFLARNDYLLSKYKGFSHHHFAWQKGRSPMWPPLQPLPPPQWVDVALPGSASPATVRSLRVRQSPDAEESVFVEVDCGLVLDTSRVLNLSAHYEPVHQHLHCEDGTTLEGCISSMQIVDRLRSGCRVAEAAARPPPPPPRVPPSLAATAAVGLAKEPAALRSRDRSVPSFIALARARERALLASLHETYDTAGNRRDLHWDRERQGHSHITKALFYSATFTTVVATTVDFSALPAASMASFSTSNDRSSGGYFSHEFRAEFSIRRQVGTAAAAAGRDSQATPSFPVGKSEPWGGEESLAALAAVIEREWPSLRWENDVYGAI